MEPRSMIVILSVAVTVLLVVGLIFFHYIPDDTFIGLRYVKHLLEGRGLVFNDGVRLEGYTDFLWLMIIAVAGRIGMPLVPAARFLGFLCSLAVLVTAGRFAWRRYPYERSTWNHALAAMLPPLILAASAPFLAWSLSGTEIPLFTLLLLVGYVLLQDRRRAEAVLAVFALSGLVRPEGLLFFAVAWTVLLLRGDGRRRAAIAGFGILALLYAPYIVWKIRYFGAVLPNTFYAKTGPAGIMIPNGARYVSGFILRYGYLLVIGLFLNAAAPERRERLLVPTAFVAAHWIALVILGGDWMPYYRLLVPTLPIVLLVVSSGLGEVRETPPDRREMQSNERWRNPVPVVVLLLISLAMVPGGIGYRSFLAERVTVGAFSHLGRYLRRVLPPDTVIGCGSTGAIGYYSGLRIIDILGLTEAQIARNGTIVARQPGHMKTDGQYVLDQEPDLLLLGNVQIHRGKRSRGEMTHKIQEQAIVVLPRFLMEYEFVQLPLSDGFYLSCYKRKDFFLPLE